MSKPAQKFASSALVAAVEAAFQKFTNGTFGDISFAKNYAPPVSTQEKLLRDIIIIELSRIAGWRHGRGFDEKDLVNRANNADSALIIVSADAVGLRQNQKEYRIKRNVPPTGYYIAVNFEPAFLVEGKMHSPRLAQVRQGLLRIPRPGNQATKGKSTIAIKYTDMRQLKIMYGAYLHDAPVSILRGIGRSGVRTLDEIHISTLGNLLDAKKLERAQGILSPQAMADLQKYLDFLQKTPKVAGKPSPPAPKIPPAPATAPNTEVVPPQPSLPKINFELKQSKLNTPALIVSNPQANELIDQSQVLQKGDQAYASKEEADLDIPLPPPPKAKQMAKVEVSDLVFFEDKYVNDPAYTYILIECEGCGGVIKMPVPKNVVLNSPLPVVPVTYVHGKGTRHALLAHLDHDFQVRRVRFSHLVEAER